MANEAWGEQVAIITGGARGLGFGLARRLAALGVRVAIFDSSTDSLQSALSALGNEHTGRALDITDDQAVRGAVDAVANEAGRLDILVNCAGITGQTNIRSHEVPMENFDRVMAINARAPAVLFQAAAPYMLERNYGRVLHVASVAGKEGNAGMLAYSMSKAAVIAMTKVQGKEYAETGITVNAVAPAVIRTDMVAAMPEEQVRYMTEKIPMKRCGTVEEFADLAAFILSPECSFTTGFTFDLTGGRATY